MLCSVQRQNYIKEIFFLVSEPNDKLTKLALRELRSDGSFIAERTYCSDCQGIYYTRHEPLYFDL